MRFCSVPIGSTRGSSVQASYVPLLSSRESGAWEEVSGYDFSGGVAVEVAAPAAALGTGPQADGLREGGTRAKVTGWKPYAVKWTCVYEISIYLSIRRSSFGPDGYRPSFPKRAVC
jgi:hypothetical protein